jgi:Protein of unknown function (DUF2783)
MKTHLNLQDADAFYEQLLNAHLGLSREESELLNARLILVMANQLGDTALLQACLDAAKAPETRASPRATGPVE